MSDTSVATPYNGETGKAYGGKNANRLIEAQVTNAFSSGAWFTYLQAKKLGAHVIGGQKGTKIIKVTPRAKDEGAPPPAPSQRQKNTLRGYTVFNVDQIEGLPETGWISISPYNDIDLENVDDSDEMDDE